MKMAVSIKPLHIKYSSGWVLVAKDHSKVLAHASTFAQIMAMSQKVPDGVAMPAAKSYHNIIM